MTQELNLTDLRKIAEAVPTGHWEAKSRAVDSWHVWGAPLGMYAPFVATVASKDEAKHIATFDPETVLQLIERAEAAEQALDFHTQRDRELKELLSMLSDRLDEFSYDELSSLIEDEPLNQWGESYESDLEQAEQAASSLEQDRDHWKTSALDAERAVATARELATTWHADALAYDSNALTCDLLINVSDAAKQVTDALDGDGRG